MPELPEVETVVRGLRGDTVGRTFVHVSVFWPRQITIPTSDEFINRLPGQRVLALDRRGKYIVFNLTQDVLLVHLKMTGRLYLTKSDEEKAEEDRWIRATFELDNGHALQFSDARKFGRLYLVNKEESVTGKLGPEPLSDDFTPDILQAVLAKRRAGIKSLLLNQQIIAGIGNIYADEALWEARIDPRRKANTLKGEEIQRLYFAICLVLQKGIDYEGASVNWYRKADGSQGNSQKHLNAYARAGKSCKRCKTALTKIRLGQRGTHFCPKCQV